MSTPPNTVNVHILDKEYLVACPPESRQQLEEAARYLNDKMNEIRSNGKIYGAERIAVMAALNIADELLQTGNKDQYFDATLEAISQRIDAALDS